MANGLTHGPTQITEAQAQGFVGLRPDATPLSGYTVIGHQVANANPESKEKIKQSGQLRHTGAVNIV